MAGHDSQRDGPRGWIRMAREPIWLALRHREGHHGYQLERLYLLWAQAPANYEQECRRRRKGARVGYRGRIDRGISCGPGKTDRSRGCQIRRHSLLERLSEGTSTRDLDDHNEAMIVIESASTVSRRGAEMRLVLQDG